MTHTRPHRTYLPLALIAAVLVLLLLTPSALAFQTRTPLGSFGPDGTAGTSFGGLNQVTPGALAFNQTSNKLYVLDRTSPATPAIHAFDVPAHTPAGGAFPISFSGGPSGATDIAVDNTSGGAANNLYAVTLNGLGGDLIHGFNSAGTALGGKFPISGPETGALCGVAVDSAGNVWVGDAGSTQSIFEYNSAGNPLRQLPISQSRICKLTFDSNDDLYVVLTNAGVQGVWKYTAASNYTAATRITTSFLGALTIDLSTHRLYVAEGEGINVYDLAGNLLYGFGVPGDQLSGVAVDESTDQVYVSDFKKQKVYVFGALANFPDATATLQAATNVAATKAELHATIDDNSTLGTNWRFEVSKDGGLTWANASFLYSGTTAGGQSGVTVSSQASSLQSNTDYRFRVVTNKGPGSPDVVSNELSFHTDLIPPAGATLNPASNVTADTADLSATIDDNGPLPTAWRFEVSKDNGVTWAKPAGEVSGSTAGSESGVAVSGTAKGLDPNTEYRFRLVTKKDPGAPDEPSSELTFTTLTAPPTVSGVGAVQITNTSASLAGEINPRNLQTSYVFDYGLTPAFGSSTPAVKLGGNELLVVSQPIAGLDPDTTYYFKLVATNSAGPSESPTLTLHTRATPLPLPEGRAYEQVSPVDKNFANVEVAHREAVAWDGSAVTFLMTAGFGDPPGQIGFIGTDYRSARGPDGWHTRWLNEPLCATEIEENIANGGTLVQGLSPNLDRNVINHSEGGNCPLPPLDPAASLPASNLYLGDFVTDPVGYQLLTPQPSFSPGYNHGSGEYAAGSDDFGHVVYTSTGQQSADAPAGDFQKLFDWHEGSLSLVSKDTANIPFATDSSVPESALNGVSSSGDRIFLQNPLANASSGSPCPSGDCELYMRQNDAVTYDVSQSECTSACGSSAADIFRFATPAGNKALFTSTAKLTNDDTSSAGEDLYLYTHSANPAANKNLTLLSKDSEPADGTKADVQGVLGISDDGNTVFFVASGQIVAGAPTAVGPKVYRWRANGGSPVVDYLATLAAEGGDALAEKLNWATGVEGGPSRPGSRAVTADGKYLLIHSSIRLDPGADHDSSEDVYRWDEQGGWACLSCQLPGTPSAGASTFQGTTITNISSNGLRNVMNEDGQRVLFTSHDALVPADTNNGLADVYEWHDGAVSLISSGTGTRDTSLFGASRSLEDVFFTTAQRLVGWDTDGSVDIYDARVGGGFPEPPPTGAVCEAEACRSAGTSAPPPATAGTAAFQGPGNPPATSGCPKGKSRKHGRCVSKNHQRKHKQRKHKRHDKGTDHRANHNRRAAR